MKTTIASLLGLWLISPAWAQSDSEPAAVADTVAAAEDIDREPIKCISPSRISRTEVIDARTVVFYMRGRDIYRNQLSNDCPRLVQEKRFSYELATNRLCDVDTISVLEYWGTELRKGMSCGLGMFYPITAEEAELLDIDPEKLQENASRVEDTAESSGEAVMPAPASD